MEISFISLYMFQSSQLLSSFHFRRCASSSRRCATCHMRSIWVFPQGSTLQTATRWPNRAWEQGRSLWICSSKESQGETAPEAQYGVLKAGMHCYSLHRLKPTYTIKKGVVFDFGCIPIEITVNKAMIKSNPKTTVINIWPLLSSSEKKANNDIIARHNAPGTKINKNLLVSLNGASSLITWKVIHKFNSYLWK